MPISVCLEMNAISPALSGTISSPSKKRFMRNIVYEDAVSSSTTAVAATKASDHDPHAFPVVLMGFREISSWEGKSIGVCAEAGR